jgi:hypothetical protein
MKQAMFVTDGELLIDLMWRYNFYGAYTLFYKELYLKEEASEILNSFGFNFSDKEIITATKDIEEYLTGNTHLIPDLLLLLKVAQRSYKNIKQRNLQQHGIDTLLFIDEIKYLNEILKEKLDDTNSQIQHIQLKFKRISGLEAFNITHKNLKSEIVLQLRNYLNQDEQKFFIKILEFPNGYEILKNWMQRHGKPSESKDSALNLERERACFMIREYLFWKGLFKIKDDLTSVSNQGAECIGKLFALIGFIETESEFSSPHHGGFYKKYLSDTIKTILRNGVKKMK